MKKKIIQAVIAGLGAAGIILFITPKFDRWNLEQEKQIISLNEAVRIASPAVVNVYNQAFDSVNMANRALQVNNLGSGVIMTTSGYILTNKHVIQNADHIIVALQSGAIYSATLVGSDSLTDLAVLKINAENLPTIPQNPKRVAKIGDIVLAIGNPLNLGQSITQGIISATGRNALSEMGRQNFIQTDASINKGNSGGALINSAGEIVGINTLSLGKNSDELAEGLNFAIPIDLATNIMRKIIKNGRVIRGYFGVSSHLFYSAQQLGADERGLLITGIAENGPAAQAGIQVGDIIIKINHIEAETPAQMMDVIAEMEPGSQAKVKISREGVIHELRVIIGEFPDIQ